MTAHSMTPMAALPFATLSDWLVAPVRMALLGLALELELPDILDSSHSLPDKMCIRDRVIPSSSTRTRPSHPLAASASAR